jgi:hypothetical protein
MSPELKGELVMLPRRDRIGLLAAALVGDPTLPKIRAVSWLVACTVKISDGLTPVEKIAVAAQLRDEADRIVAEIEWPRFKCKCDPR